MPKGQYDRTNITRRPHPPTEAPVTAHPQAAPREDLRPEQRPAMRAADPRADSLARAAARVAEIMGNGDPIEGGEDKFYVNPETIPAGFTYEWKRKEVLGKEDPAYAVSLARTGWEPVPADRHPEMMPSGWKGGSVEREGMVLMERPIEITRMIQDKDRREARSLVKDKEAQLNEAASGQFERSNKGNSLVKVKRSYAPVPVADE